MLDLTEYIQILHNLTCWSVCHLPTFAHLPQRPVPPRQRDPKGSATLSANTGMNAKEER